MTSNFLRDGNQVEMQVEDDLNPYSQERINAEENKMMNQIENNQREIQNEEFGKYRLLLIITKYMLLIINSEYN